MLKKWLVLPLLAACCISGRAQVVQAVRVRTQSLTLGGTFQSFNPDYTLTWLKGFGAYVDYVPYRYRLATIGLEGELLPLNLNQVSHVHERTASIGPIVSVGQFYGLRPFAKLEYGLGNFYYPYFTSVRPKFYTDSYGVWATGAGADYSIRPRVSIRAEYEYQRWTHFRGAKTLNPNGIIIGVSYRIF